jgi:hypothetical protein
LRSFDPGFHVRDASIADVRPSLPLGATTEYDRSGQSSDSCATRGQEPRRSEGASSFVARLRTGCRAHTPEGVRDRLLGAEWGQAPRGREPGLPEVRRALKQDPPKQIPPLRAANRLALPGVGGWPDSRLGRAMVAARTQGRFQLHPLWGRGLGEGASPSHRSWPKPRSRRRGSSWGCARPKPRAPDQSSFEAGHLAARRSGPPAPSSRSRLPSGLHRGGAPMQDAQHGESDGSSRGVRALSAFRAQGSITPDCLSGALRSRGFSPPQRFDPPRASWLCFAPHPPLGFSWSSELFPLCQPWRLSAPSALLPFGWLVATLERTRESPRAPGRGMLLAHLPLAERHPEPGALHLPAELDIDPRSCSPKRAGLWARGRDPVAVSTQRQMPSTVGSRKATRNALARHEPATSEPCSGRASVLGNARLGTPRADALLTFCPSEVFQLSRWARALPSCACSPESLSTRRHTCPRARRTSGCQSD